MCGIAGYSLSPESSVNRTLSAQALLAGIPERGADAVGYAFRGAGRAVTVHKRRSAEALSCSRICSSVYRLRIPAWKSASACGSMPATAGWRRPRAMQSV